MTALTSIPPIQRNKSYAEASDYLVSVGAPSPPIADDAMQQTRTRRKRGRKGADVLGAATGGVAGDAGRPHPLEFLAAQGSSFLQAHSHRA
jgi:hypothetical protein